MPLTSIGGSDINLPQRSALLTVAYHPAMAEYAGAMEPKVINRMLEPARRE